MAGKAGSVRRCRVLPGNQFWTEARGTPRGHALEEDRPGLEARFTCGFSSQRNRGHGVTVREEALTPGPRKELAKEVARLVHAEQPIEAARIISDALKLKFTLKKKDDPAKAYSCLSVYIHDLLETNGAAEAAQILWSPTQFTPEPNSVKMVWKLFDESDTGIIMGASKMGKSYGIGVRLFLEWMRDPMFTSVRVVGPTQDHLEANLFSHLVALHANATIPMPGEAGQLFLGLTRRDQLSAIRGIIIPRGDRKKAGRLQGGHRRPRPVPHPIFGPLSRLFIFVDEVENVPGGIWHDVSNVLSDVEKRGGQGFKIFMAYNPSDLSNEVAKYAEPPFGWYDLDMDKHFRWTSQRGWEVLRLDAEQSENVKTGEIVYPGLQTRHGLEKIAVSSGGRNSKGYLTMGRGMYPLNAIESVVVPAGMWAKWRGNYVWSEDPRPVGSLDLALEGGDEAVFTLGLWGKATGVVFPPTLGEPKGLKVMFKDDRGNVIPRWGLQVRQQFALPKGDTIKMKEEALKMVRKAGISPEFFACDRTGHGAGVADLLKYEWSTLLHDVQYSSGASETKLMQEDSKNCCEEYERMFSELWFALRAWGEFGYVMIDPGMDLTKLTSQVISRRFIVRMGKKCVESKRDFMSRGFTSPNDADSLTLLVHAARRGSNLVPSMRGRDVEAPGNIWDDWDIAANCPSGVRIDDSNRFDALESPERIPGQFGDGWDGL